MVHWETADQDPELGEVERELRATRGWCGTASSRILEYPWGYIAVFEDPDGNRLQLREGR